ncbi:MAG: hypothetical protein MHPSP_004066 [Paramarteilia canceri]
MALSSIMLRQTKSKVSNPSKYLKVASRAEECGGVAFTKPTGLMMFLSRRSAIILGSISSCRFLTSERQTDSVEFTNSSLGYAFQFRCRISESFTSSMYRK